MSILYDEWLAASENWRSSSYVAVLKRRLSNERIGSRRWMTFRQIVAKYDGDEAIARSITENKLRDEELAKRCTKPHPDCPDRLEALDV